MTHAERQALREKHYECVDVGEARVYCGNCGQDYPCDVIKVLDALELHEALVGIKPECDHELYSFVYLDTYDSGLGEYTPFDCVFCPKCGEKISLFGNGGGAESAVRLSKLVGAEVPLIARIPFTPELREGGDNGNPIVISQPQDICQVQMTFMSVYKWFVSLDFVKVM